MPSHISLIALLVTDCEAAIRFFTQALRFELREDSGPGSDPRWLVVGPRGLNANSGPGLMLRQAKSQQELALVGRQAGSGVLLILDSEDFRSDYAHMQAAGVRFVEAPREELYGTVAVFEDVSGNRWDLIQRTPTSK